MTQYTRVLQIEPRYREAHYHSARLYYLSATDEMKKCNAYTHQVKASEAMKMSVENLKEVLSRSMAASLGKGGSR